ncbi:NUDIX domain-containing protein [Streptomyces sp. NBC_01615]|uniref:NUDIX domain-containing protein n=1 Tax=Streptomyces sp. NBC_01615 TaxID=2975898 RepID=UPI00386C493B
MLITDEQHRVLLVHTIESKPRWGLPGGLVKPHERPRAGAEREIREELGLSTEAARSPASQ